MFRLAAFLAVAALSASAHAAGSPCKLSGARRENLESKGAFDRTTPGKRVFVFTASAGAVTLTGRFSPTSGDWMGMAPYDLGNVVGALEVTDATGGKKATWRVAPGDGVKPKRLKLTFSSTSNDGPRGVINATLSPVAGTGAKGDVEVQCGF